VVSGYCATKAALANMLEGLRVELAPWGITVTTVRPDFARTPLTAHVRAEHLLIDAETAARTVLKGIAARRREINFPWHSALLMGLVSRLPCPIYDHVAGAILRKRIVTRRGNSMIGNRPRQAGQPHETVR